MKFELKTLRGNSITIEGEMKKKVVPVRAEVCGEYIQTGEQLYVNAHVSFSAAGKWLGCSDSSDPLALGGWRAVKPHPETAKSYKIPEGAFWIRMGCGKFLITEEEAERFNAWLAELVASGDTEETLRFAAAEQKKADMEEIASQRKRIACAEEQKAADGERFPATRAAAKALEKARMGFYREEYGEDAGARAPHIYSQEELDQRRARLDELEKRI